jgi:hypothetical protein
MDNKFDKFIHPFRYIGGWWSVLWGVLILIATAFISRYSSVHFPDAISVKVAASLSFWGLLLQAFINWTVITTVFYVSGLLFSSTRIRFIDVLGTQGMARLPYLLVSFTGFSNSLKLFGEYLIQMQLKTGEPIEVSTMVVTLAILILILQILLTIWMVAWMYQAFSTAVNLKGGKGAAVFTVSLIIAIAITFTITYFSFSWQMTL